jgi:transcriptional regulator with XRE-family HTH domain/quercetin dioxygenase-like cupin family protein
VNVNVGNLIRRERQKQGLSLRELARRVGVSASMLSQVETGRTRPSVSTIYAIATELGVSIDALLSDSDVIEAAADSNGTDAAADSSVSGLALARRNRAGAIASAAPAVAGLASQLVRPEDRRKLELESGVTWELLSDLLPHLVDFMFVTYEPGGRSSSSGKMVRHSGTEFAFLLRGELKIQVGFDEYVLQSGDALAFDSTEPHLLVNEGSEPAEGIWFVLGRRLTPESHAARDTLPGERAARVFHRGGLQHPYPG